MPRHRSEQEINAAINAYLDGKTVDQVATSIRASEATVRGWLYAAGVQLRPRGLTPRHREQQAKRAGALSDLETSGDSLTVVAERHGLARSTLLRWSRGSNHDVAYEGEWVRDGLILRPAKRVA